jgi:multicomponent Na+:H+ antiporter subunit C
MFLSLLAIFSKPNLFQRLFALSIFQTNIIIFFLSICFNKEAKIPLIDDSNPLLNPRTLYENPLPQVLMLTAIVVGLSTFALGLSILFKYQIDNKKFS